MPDQPDDAPKRQQRGVLPPFFAPRSGRGERPSPVPASGAWRRVSRLFTPPDVARQRGAPAGPQTPPTQPSAPANEHPEASQATDLQLPPDASPEAPGFRATPVATPVITPVATPTAPPMAASFSFDIAESSRAQTLDDMGWPQPDFAGGAESGQLPAAEAEPDVFDGVGEGDLVVESLEPEPISLALPDLAAAGAGVDNEVWAVERSALDPFDDPGDVAATASSDAFDAGVETDRAADSAAYGAWDSESAEGSIDAAAPEHTAPFSRDDESWGADDSTPFDTSSNWPDAAPSRGDYAAWDEPAAPATYDDAAHEPPEEVRAAAPELTPEVVDAEHAADVSLVAWPSYERVSESPAYEHKSPVAVPASPTEPPGSVYELPALESDVPAPPDEIVAASTELALPGVASDPPRGAESVGSADESAAVAGSAVPVASDAWADVDLPEPAFGSSGWPMAAAEVDDSPEWTGESSGSELAPPVAGEHPLGGLVPDRSSVEEEPVDEMSAALAWNDAEAEHDGQLPHGGADADEGAPAGEDTFTAVAHELRDTSAAWAPVDGAGVDAVSDPREHFATLLGDGAGAWSGSSAGARQGSEEGAEADAGSAIADALARVAERIRAGEVELSAETAGASDESALAAALAALLRGPRRR